MADATGDEVGASEMNRRVSEVLKRIRKQRELSLDQLATRSGVSRACAALTGASIAASFSPSGSESQGEMYELQLAPKGVLRSEPHGKGTTETVYLLKGAVRINVCDAEHDLLAGDSIFFRADVPHEYENKSAQEARLLDLITYER